MGRKGWVCARVLPYTTSLRVVVEGPVRFPGPERVRRRGRLFSWDLTDAPGARGGGAGVRG